MTSITIRTPIIDSRLNKHCQPYSNTVELQWFYDLKSGGDHFRIDPPHKLGETIMLSGEWHTVIKVKAKRLQDCKYFQRPVPINSSMNDDDVNLIKWLFDRSTNRRDQWGDKYPSSLWSDNPHVWLIKFKAVE